MHGLGYTEKKDKSLNHGLREWDASNCHTRDVFCSHILKPQIMTLIWVKEFLVICYTQMVDGGPI